MVFKNRIALKIIIILLLSNFLAGGLFLGWIYIDKNKAEYHALQTELVKLDKSIPANIEQALAGTLPDKATAIAQVAREIKTAMEAPDLQAIVVHLPGGQFFYGQVKEVNEESKTILSAEHYSALLTSALRNPYQRTSHKLLAADRSETGSVQLFFTDASRKNTTRLAVRSILIPLLTLILLSVFLTFFCIYILMVRPLRAVLKKTTELSEKQGNLTKKLTIHSHDEIGQLARFLNTFIDGLNEQFGQIKESSESLNHSITELSETSHKIASTSNHQAAAVKEIVATMEDSDKLTKSISAGSHEVVELSQSSKKNVQEGFTIIQMNQQKMDEIKITNAKVLSQIRHLDESIKNILKILTIINSIADQTKIIAFNAELEAFQAGEAGKNFEIVANEIRRLADNTIHSTKEIQKSLAEIQNAAKHVNLSSQESAEKISEGWQLSSKVETLFDNILHSSEVSTQAAEKINLSIKQNSAALEQIFITLKQLASGVAEIAETTQDMNISSTGIRQLINNLEKIVREHGLKPTIN